YSSFIDTAPAELYTPSLHDALPIWPPDIHARRAADRGADLGKQAGAIRANVAWARQKRLRRHRHKHGLPRQDCRQKWRRQRAYPDRKSTRLNSSHVKISYAVFCLKK